MFSVATVSAQKGYKNPEEYSKEADKLFENNEFQKAFSYYQTLRSNDMGNADYNFRLGVCMMFSQPENKEKPIYYFNISLKLNIEDNRIHYYLGRAYHNNYRFGEAKESYEQYSELAKGKYVKSFNIQRRIQECENGIALLSHINLLYVIDKQLVKSTTFYKSYNIEGSGAKIVAIPVELRTKYDNKHNAPPFGLFFPKGDMFYYASYGSRGVNGLDIYRSHHEEDGSWAKIENMGPQINTPYDDAYPYITIDGKTLYFSSKGHNSMGGYDVFKSTFDLNSFSWQASENLNFPINTPFDDIFYVPDTNITLAHFSSDRQSLEGRVYVYYVGISKQEQQQDLSKVFREGGDATNIVKLLKDIAELKTNINVDDYKKKEKKLDTNVDEIIAVTDSNKTKRYITKRSDLKDDDNFDDIVKESYNTYKRLQYTTIKLRKQKTTIGKIAAQNDNLVDDYKAKGDSSSLEMAKQYKEAADISRDIAKKLDVQIKKTEKVTEEVLIQAGELQKQAGMQNKDSVEDIFKEIVELNEIVSNFEEPTKEIIEQKYALMRAVKERANLKRLENEKFKNGLNELKAELSEYEIAMKESADEDEKQEYADMIAAMKVEVQQKTDKQAKLQSEYDELQATANTEAKKLAVLNSSLNQYFEVANVLAAEEMSDELSVEIDKQIQEVKQKSEEYIAVNAPKSDTTKGEISLEEKYDKEWEEANREGIAATDKNNESHGVIAEPSNDKIAEAQKIGAETTAVATNSTDVNNNSDVNNIENSTNSDGNIAQLAQNEKTNSINSYDSKKNSDNALLDSVNADNIDYVKVGGDNNYEILADNETNTSENNVGNSVINNENSIDSNSIDSNSIANNESQNNNEVKVDHPDGKAALDMINKAHGKIPEKTKENNEVETEVIAESKTNDANGKNVKEGQIVNNNETINNTKETKAKTNIEFTSIGNTEANKAIDTTKNTIANNDASNNIALNTNNENQVEQAEDQIISNPNTTNTTNPNTTNTTNSNTDITNNNSNNTVSNNPNNVNNNNSISNTNIAVNNSNTNSTNNNTNSTSTENSNNSEYNSNEIASTNNVASGNNQLNNDISNQNNVTDENNANNEIVNNSNTINNNSSELNSGLSKNNNISSADMQTFNAEIERIQNIVTKESNDTKSIIENNNNTIGKLKKYAINEYNKAEIAQQEYEQLKNSNKQTNTEGVTLETLNAKAIEHKELATIAYKKANALETENKNNELKLKKLTELESKTNQWSNSSETDKLDEYTNIANNEIKELNNISNTSEQTNAINKVNYDKNTAELVIVNTELEVNKKKNDSLISIKQDLVSQGNNSIELQEINNLIEANNKEFIALKTNEKELASFNNEEELTLAVMDDINSNKIDNEAANISKEDEIAISQKLDNLISLDSRNNENTMANSDATANNNLAKNNQVNDEAIDFNKSSDIIIDGEKFSIPEYEEGSDKAELVKEYIEPSIEELNRIKARKNNNNLLIAKSIGLEIRYSNMANNISDEIFRIDSKRRQTTDEQLKNRYISEIKDKQAQYIAIKRKESAAALYSETLKTENDQLDNQYEAIAGELTSNVQKIETEANVKTINIENTENAITLLDAKSPEQLYIETINNSNKNNEERITEVENIIENENLNYADLVQKLDAATAKYENETKESKKNKLKIEITKLEEETQNSRYIVNNYKKEKSDLEADIQKNTNIVEAVNSHIISLKSSDIVASKEDIEENVNKTESISTGIFKLESRFNDEDLGMAYVEVPKEQELPYYNENSIDFVYFDKTDIANHKKLLLLKQLNLIDKQLDILAQRSMNTVDINKKAKINESVKSLNKEKDDVQTLIYNLDEFIVYIGGDIDKSNKYSSQELILKIKLQKDKFNLASIMLRDTAKYFDKEKEQKVLDLANELQNKNKQLDIAINEIEQYDIINKYRENLIILAEIHYNIANDQLANIIKIESDKADANFTLAQKNRASAMNNELSINEIEQLERQAAEYEQLAISIQERTIIDYGSENQIAMINNRSYELDKDISTDVVADKVINESQIIALEALESADEEQNDSLTYDDYTQELALNENNAVAESISQDSSIANETETDNNQKIVANNRNEDVNTGNTDQIENTTTAIIENNNQKIAVNNINNNGQVNGETNNTNSNKVDEAIDNNAAVNSDNNIVENTVASNETPNNNEQNKNVDNVVTNNDNTEFNNSNSVDLVYSNINFQEIELEQLAAIDENKLPDNKIEEYRIRKADMLGIYIGSNRRGVNTMSFYNKEERILIDPRLPNGLVFKVQIAAFRKPIPANTFGDIKPINGETSPTSTFTRYMAGLFTNYTDANGSKNVIRTKGYKDAFVVAYFNGRRISVRQARAMIANGTAYTDTELLAVANKLKVDNYGQSKAADANSSAYTGIAIDKALNNNSGIVYTVQIGVFRGERSSQRLANAPDIFFNRTTKGYHRYFSGKYNNRNTAINARNQIRANGIKDAFVIVFNNGKRITTAQARIIEQQTTNNKQQTTNNEQQTQSTEQQTQSTEQQTTNTQQQTTNIIVFKVQLGAFRSNRVGAQLQELERLSDNGLDTYNVGNLIKYTTRSYMSYTDAVNARNRIRTIGAKDVFVIAFKGGTKISVRDARRELGQ